MAASSRRNSLPILSFLALSALAGAAAAAEPSPEGTVWRCWYNGDTRIQCLLKSAAETGAASPYVQARLPAVVKQLWVAPETLAGRRVFIPLFGEPDDWNRVRLLAESVMCGASAGCAVEFNRSYAEAVLLDPAVEE
jgi:hypothetical protein